ncbi:MAG: hypothetical protein ABJA67_14965 [Chthonomonadales bacterium]
MADKPQDVAGEQVGDALQFYEFMESHGEEGRRLLQKSKCDRCGLTYPDFLKIGLVGCTKCYQTFRPAIEAALVILHQSSAVPAGK